MSIYVLLDEKIFRILDKNNIMIDISNNTELEHISPRSSYLKIKIPKELSDNEDFRNLICDEKYLQKRGILYITPIDCIPKDAELNTSLIKHHTISKKKIIHSILFSCDLSELIIILTSLERIDPFNNLISDDYDIYIDIQ